MPLGFWLRNERTFKKTFHQNRLHEERKYEIRKTVHAVMWNLRNYSTLDSNAKLNNPPWYTAGNQHPCLSHFSASGSGVGLRSCVTLRPLCFHIATENICIDFFYLCVCLCLLLADSVCLWVQEAVICWLGENQWVFSSRSHCASCQGDSVFMKWNLRVGATFSSNTNIWLSIQYL